MIEVAIPEVTVFKEEILAAILAAVVLAMACLPSGSVLENAAVGATKS